MLIILDFRRTLCSDAQISLIVYTHILKWVLLRSLAYNTNIMITVCVKELQVFDNDNLTGYSSNNDFFVMINV